MMSALDDAIEMAHGFGYRLTQERYEEAQDELEKLRAELAAAQRTIEAQAARIDALEQDVWPWRM